MDLLIMKLEQANEYVPDKPTYVIRIFSSFFYERFLRQFPLKQSRNYVAIKDYVFDDNDFGYEAGPVWITNNLSRQMISDFQTHRKNVEALLVHCTGGKNRSPAVAIAFNDIFDFGYSTQELMKKYDAYNRHTYRTLIESAREMGLIK